MYSSASQWPTAYMYITPADSSARCACRCYASTTRTGIGWSCPSVRVPSVDPCHDDSTLGHPGSITRCYGSHTDDDDCGDAVCARIHTPSVFRLLLGVYVAVLFRDDSGRTLRNNAHNADTLPWTLEAVSRPKRE